MNMWPSASRSSRRLYADSKVNTALNHIPARPTHHSHSPLPRCVLMLMRVPCLSGSCARYGMCFLVSGAMYSLAKPKSMMWMACCRFVLDTPH